MSLLASRAVWDGSAATGSAFTLLLAIADAADREGVLAKYPRSHTWLAKRARVHPDSVRRLVRELEEVGELVVLRRGNGRAKTDYQIVLPGLASGPCQDDEQGRDAPRRERDVPPITPTTSPKGSSDHDVERPPDGAPAEGQEQDHDHRIAAGCLAVAEALIESGHWHTKPDPTNTKAWRWCSRRKMVAALAEAWACIDISQNDLIAALQAPAPFRPWPPTVAGIKAAVAAQVPEPEPVPQPRPDFALPFELDEWRKPCTDITPLTHALHQALDHEVEDQWRRRLGYASGFPGEPAIQAEVLEAWFTERGGCLR